MRSKYVENIQIYYDTGELQSRHSCYLAMDRAIWVLHGQLLKFHKNGQIAIRGNFYDGFEDGPWVEYYPSGQLAVEGEFDLGHQKPGWRRWDEVGNPI